MQGLVLQTLNNLFVELWDFSVKRPLQVLKVRPFIQIDQVHVQTFCVHSLNGHLIRHQVQLYLN